MDAGKMIRFLYNRCYCLFSFHLFEIWVELACFRISVLLLIGEYLLLNPYF